MQQVDECRLCGGPLLKVKERLYICRFCGNYFPDTSPTAPLPSLRVVSEPDKLKDLIVGMETQEGGLSSDMLTFTARVAERLVPTTGLTGDMAQQVQKVQDDIRREFIEVFQGKRNFEKWFNQTKTNLALHPQKFTTILYESLEGLKSPEAQELREGYAQALARMRGM